MNNLEKDKYWLKWYTTTSLVKVIAVENYTPWDENYFFSAGQTPELYWPLVNFATFNCLASYVFYRRQTLIHGKKL